MKCFPFDAINADFEATLIQTRNHLHSYPELSFEEHNTSKFITQQLLSIGINTVQNIGNTGIVALITGKNPNQKCVALRADIDALPIQEENEVHYKSKNAGIMHACGHDVHTTCLLGAARLLYENRDKFEGTIKLIFQPGEEKSPGGASILIKEGVLENPKVECIAGLHVAPDLKVGTAGFKPGPYMASADEIHLTIKGKSGHAAMPHLAVDVITASASFITQIQTLLQRKKNPLQPFVLSFGKIQGGETTNVIPESVHILGTFRTFDEAWRASVKTHIETVCADVCQQYGATFELQIPPGYPCLINEPQLTTMVQKSAETLLGNENVIDLPARMSSEDFSFYAQSIPATFFRLGTQNDSEATAHSVHSSRFDIAPEALKIGTLLMANAGLAMLQNETIH